MGSLGSQVPSSDGILGWVPTGSQGAPLGPGPLGAHWPLGTRALGAEAPRQGLVTPTVVSQS